MTLFHTEKLYYQNAYATRNLTRWARREQGVVAVERSVAFPEGGGQLGDRGWLCHGGLTATFRDTQKVLGRCVVRPDFPMIHVDGEIRLHLEGPLPEGWDEAQPIEVRIDPVFRAQLARSHTAAHLVYLGLLAVVPDAKEAVRGCYIEPSGGRFDLRLGRLSPEQVGQIAAVAATWQAADHPVSAEALPGEPECRVWVCGGARIPCGGMHLPQTGLVGPLTVQRRSKGKGLERVYYTITDPVPVELLRRYGEVVDPQ